MIDIESLIGDIIKKSTRLERDTTALMKNETHLRDKTEKAFDNSLDASFLAYSTMHDSALRLHSGVKKITLLLQMSLAVMGMMNEELKQLKKDNPTMRKKLEHNIGKKISPLIQKLDEHQKIEDDINKKAKDREDKIGGMFGQY